MKRLIALAALVALIAGCSSMQYYMSAVSGHLDVMNRARPIDDLLAETSTPQALRSKLQQVQVMRNFATEELGLPDNGSYRGYADVGRPYVVWNVFAAPELSVEPHQSCFAIVGCVTYRGYYTKAEADAYAAQLQTEGFDTYIGGVPAYSTLGFFEDPVLNTFVGYPDAEVARLMFHELAHQMVFIKGDTTFNESFAVAVEREGMRRWLQRTATDVDSRAFVTYGERREGFYKLVLGYREKLNQLFRAKSSDADKRAAKQRLYAEMHADYENLKNLWGGYAGYDRFFTGVNNASLASLAAYTQMVPAFEALLEREDGNLPRFYAAASQLSKLDKPMRDVRLAALMTSTLSAHAGDVAGGAANHN